MRYVAFLHPPSGRGNWSANFPDLPGCVATGHTFEDAWAAARGALSLHLEGLAEDREAAPLPRRLDEIAADASIATEIAGAYPVLVGAHKPAANRQQIDVLIDEALLQRLDRRAEEDGVTRSRMIEHALVEVLDD